MPVDTAPAACGFASGCVLLPDTDLPQTDATVCPAAALAPPNSSSSNSPTQLPPDLLMYILRLRPHNDIAISVRRTCKAAWMHFCEEHHCAALLSQPLPQHALTEAALQLQPQLRLLSLEQKLQLLATAASSGSETNMGVAWDLVRPSLAPGMVAEDSQASRSELCGADAGVTAVRHGHVHLVEWMGRAGCPLEPDCLRPCCTPRRGTATWRGCSARGRCSSLHVFSGIACSTSAAEGQEQGQQQQWQQSALISSLFNSAAESTAPDALAKMEWLADLGPLCSFADENHAVVAASSGDVGRLEWLQDRGCPVANPRVLDAALRCGDMRLVSWLEEQAGHQLLPFQDHQGDYNDDDGGGNQQQAFDPAGSAASSGSGGGWRHVGCS